MENFQDRGVWVWIRFVLRGWIRIRSISDRICNPGYWGSFSLLLVVFWSINTTDGIGNLEVDGILYVYLYIYLSIYISIHLRDQRLVILQPPCIQISYQCYHSTALSIQHCYPSSSNIVSLRSCYPLFMQDCFPLSNYRDITPNF